MTGSSTITILIQPTVEAAQLIVYCVMMLAAALVFGSVVRVIGK